MRKLSFLAALFLLVPAFAAASGGSGSVGLLDPAIDLKDSASLQRGAKLFVSYCLSCHNASLARYNRMAADIGLTDDQVKAMMFATDKVGDVMKVAMSSEDAAAWFGTQPPDLSVVSRSRGIEWLYSYLLGFYKDDNPSRPFGVNNVIFPDVAMPHVLSGLQGVQIRKSSHADEQHASPQGIDDLLELAQAGDMTIDEYRSAVRDLVAFLAYLGEPTKLQRQQLGVWVLLFLAVLFVFSYALKKEYWKDVKKLR
uniref:Ubiquinol-cytochrome c reductase cytochrome c1 subunit n=1 Tax=Candidatus Kentrum sp. LPFa TaxID=2126335 RepID=A0A450XV41_9GAMM|nr:MAG: ubiquinol-cytochrome c reductase cytochrome c1 subunit [Candidatus Kentron sp. LPFa]VFK33171.1 MAG: ubiquinol-cytochrome c reductase cytochrome c1 subunit [Candidatus Kentron sp. LPFa]